MSEFDEGRYAGMVSEEMQTTHHAYPFDQDFLKDFDKIVWHLDEPFAISSAFATFYLAKNTSKHAKVVLTGDGGDELLAGYQGYANDHYLRYPEYFFSFLTQMCSVLHFTLKHSHLKNKFALRLLTGLSRRAGNEGVRYSEQVAQNGLHAISMAFNSDYFFDILENWTDNLTAYFYNNLDSEDRLLRKLYSSFMTRLVDEMLMKVDRMTMAHSLEARVPLLDHNLVEFAFSLPSQMKLKNKGAATIGKYIFKKVMDKYLPEEIVYREKKGFNIPIGNWLNGPFKDDITEQIKCGCLMKYGILNPKGIDKIMKENKTATFGYTNMLLLLFSFEKWMSVYQDEFGPIVFR
jgi:asparagine synthase (glutamine-hydrolysing)